VSETESGGTLAVYLVPAARGRFELYTETADGDDAVGEPEVAPQRWLGRTVLAASRQWREWVERARRGGDHGWVATLRDRIVRAVAESVAAQRTLWSLRGRVAARVEYPHSLTLEGAERVVQAILAQAERHHGRWAVVDLLLFLASGVFMPIPGPNVVAFYLAFRLVGHWLSWRGARHARAAMRWTYEANAALSELASLVELPRAVRAARVEAIAERLNLSKLSAFFDRVAIPSA
jgi:hypothetical protein